MDGSIERHTELAASQRNGVAGLWHQRELRRETRQTGKKEPEQMHMDERVGEGEGVRARTSLVWPESRLARPAVARQKPIEVRTALAADPTPLKREDEKRLARSAKQCIPIHFFIHMLLIPTM